MKVDSGDLTGVTIQVGVGDIVAAVAWYGRLLGRPPDLEPHTDFKEWELIPGCWLQVTEDSQRSLTRALRLGVADIERATRRLTEDLEIEPSDQGRIEGLAAWCNFCDPWGNHLGFFQDLADGMPREPGGSVRDFS